MIPRSGLRPRWGFSSDENRSAELSLVTLVGVSGSGKSTFAQYLRIIYGPEYTLDEPLERLRSRRLGAKRSLALREYALGLEALHRFVEGEPLYRVHECAFGVLALESEPVDPRL